MELKNILLVLATISFIFFGIALCFDLIDRTEAKNVEANPGSIQSCKNLCLAFDDTGFVNQARFGGQTICYCEKELNPGTRHSKKIRFGVIDPGNN